MLYSLTHIYFWYYSYIRNKFARLDLEFLTWHCFMSLLRCFVSRLVWVTHSTILHTFIHRFSCSFGHSKQKFYHFSLWIKEPSSAFLRWVNHERLWECVCVRESDESFLWLLLCLYCVLFPYSFYMWCNVLFCVGWQSYVHRGILSILLSPIVTRYAVYIVYTTCICTVNNWSIIVSDANIYL